MGSGICAVALAACAGGAPATAEPTATAAPHRPGAVTSPDARPEQGSPPAASAGTGAPTRADTGRAPTVDAAASPDAAPAPMEPEVRVDASAARRAIDPYWRKLVDQAWQRPAVELHPPEPLCSPQQCVWRFVITAAGRDERAPVGFLDVDVTTGEATWLPRDGTGERWDPERYVAYRSQADRAISQVSRLPAIRAYCEGVMKQGLGCLLYVDNREVPPPCPPDGPIAECTWYVYVGETHPGSHASRHVTILVAPPAMAVVAASDPGCGPVGYRDWVQYRNLWQRHAQSGGPEPSCPPPWP